MERLSLRALLCFLFQTWVVLVNFILFKRLLSRVSVFPDSWNSSKFGRGVDYHLVVISIRVVSVLVQLGGGLLLAHHFFFALVLFVGQVAKRLLMYFALAVRCQPFVSNVGICVMLRAVSNQLLGPPSLVYFVQLVVGRLGLRGEFVEGNALALLDTVPRGLLLVGSLLRVVLADSPVEGLGAVHVLGLFLLR
jgi:hypothetical protein